MWDFSYVKGNSYEHWKGKQSRRDAKVNGIESSLASVIYRTRIKQTEVKYSKWKTNHNIVNPYSETSLKHSVFQISLDNF